MNAYEQRARDLDALLAPAELERQSMQPTLAQPEGAPMSDTKDLVQRLRATRRKDCCDAADTIEALQAALGNSGNRHVYEAPPGMVFVAQGTIERLTAERDARVPVLTDDQIDAIAKTTSPTCGADLTYDERRTVWDRAFARAVLAAAHGNKP